MVVKPLNFGPIENDRAQSRPHPAHGGSEMRQISPLLTRLHVVYNFAEFAQPNLVAHSVRNWMV
jgi:hypothetical protein